MRRTACCPVAPSRAHHRSLCFAALILALVAGSADAGTVVPIPVPRPSATAEASPATVVAALEHAPADIATPPRPVPRPRDATWRLAPGDAAWRNTLAYAEDGAWDKALAVPGRSRDPHLAAVLLWLSLQDDKRPTDFATVSDFLTRHHDWPGEPQLETLAEKLMPGNLPASIRAVWFDAHPPRTSAARLAYLDALEQTGASNRLVDEVRRTWREIELGEKTQTEFLARYGKYLRPIDHQERLDQMLWRGHAAAATRTLPLVSQDWRKLAEARMRLRQDSAGVDQAVAAVPKALRDDPGLQYERIRWRRAKGFSTSARELLFEAPGNAEFAALWWRERSWHIREALDAGNMEDAYLLAASHVQQRGTDFADAEWLAGWIALRFLDRPKDALRHFQVLYENVSTPISRGRAAYWAGRAAEALGDAAAARTWYGRGAEHPTTFYGQLAAARMGATEISLGSTVPPSAEKIRAFRSRELVQVTEALIRVGRQKLAERFLRTLAYRSADEDESYLIAEMATQAGYVSTAVYAARRAVRSGAALVEIGYPMLDRVPDMPPEPALVHAIIRQESGFDPEAVSRAGARGLMQLMPATARSTAKAVGVDYDLGSLLANPEYNVVLGRHYLASMVERFGGHYVLAIAAYNAGPGRVQQWIARNGHPADPSVDVIDWIEKIPFSETRNYVQRVLEGLHVYRSRLAQEPLLAPDRANWRPHHVWCVYACGVLLDRQQAALSREKKG